MLHHPKYKSKVYFNLFLRFSHALFFLLVVNFGANAQLSGYNIMEYQLGNIPEVKPNDLSTLYNQLNVRYRYNDIKAFARVEQFYSTDSIERDYQTLSQYSFEYDKNNFEFKAGNFYETLGRGLLLRSFEIPGSILEDFVYRTRQSFNRDILGFYGKYQNEHFMLKAMRGKALNNTVPPDNEFRRTDLVEALEGNVNFLNQTAGILVMRNNFFNQHITYSGLTLEGNLPFQISYYGEYVQKVGKQSLFEFNDGSSYGVYGGINYSLGSFGASFELKDFHNLLIGSGLSDPPTLVKEHSYKVLNRSTHVTNLIDESGFQIEAYYYFNDGKSLTINASRARSERVNTTIFAEYFAEFYLPFNNGGSVKLFADYAKEEILLEDNRYAGGIYTIIPIVNSWNISVEGELQYIDKQNIFNDPNLDKPIYNMYSGLIVSKSTNFSIALAYELSTDPLIADKSETIEKVEDLRHFIGGNITYRPDFRNTFNLFVGQRRGGPACSSGVCYEILDFEGAELRWTIRF